MTQIIHFTFRIIPFCLPILVFLFGTQFFLSKNAEAEEMLRVAVKSAVPLTQAVVDQLAPYGQVNNILWEIDVIDMQVAEASIPSLEAHPQVEYVEREQPGFVQTVTVDDILNGSFY